MCRTASSRLLCRLVVDAVILIAVYCIALIALPQLLPTTQRGFFCSDNSLRYPYTATLLSRVHITILVIALPAAALLIVEMLCAALRNTPRTAAVQPSSSSSSRLVPVQQFNFVGNSVPSFVSECYKIVGVYYFGLALTLIALCTTKHWIGRLRPYFFDVCQPQLSAALGGGDACAASMPISWASNHSAYITSYKCYELAASAELLASVRHSFPSGYTTTVSYAMCFLLFYLQARLAAAGLCTIRTLLQFGCSILLMFVAIERVYSHRNHWTDVLAGIGLGLALAAFVTIAVADVFRKQPLKRRKLRDDAPRIYGYYGMNRVIRCT